MDNENDLPLNDQQVQLVEKSIATNTELIGENIKLREELRNLKDQQESSSSSLKEVLAELNTLMNTINSGRQNTEVTTARRRRRRQTIAVPKYRLEIEDR